ncbi:MAG: hypothetical protein IT370_32480, partial [Deltaproteobacteria bacterium]|nr:hypothetical protein [Deltaproteobacteria bacterium]
PLALALVAGCGSDESGTPLRSGAITAEYAGTAFTPVNGFATTYMGKSLIVVGDGPVHCGSESNNDPPSGRNASFSVMLAAGSYSNVFVNLYENVSSFHGVGANKGTVTLTSVTAESVAGTIAFDYTADDGKHYALNGSFDVVHCTP